MLIVSPIPGQEANNTSYLTMQGAAIEVDNPKDLAEVVNDLYNHRDKLNQLSNAALKTSKPHSANDIASLLLER